MSNAENDRIAEQQREASEEPTKLYRLQSKMPLPLRIEFVDTGIENAICHHLDGMYSYCYKESDKSATFHLSASTPMIEVDGRWEIAKP